MEDTIFFKVPSHWNKNNVRAHYYNEQGGSNGWPGDLMTKTIYENIYCLKIKKELNMTNIIFNDGSNQIPEICKFGFSIADRYLYNSMDYEKKSIEKDSNLEDTIFFKVPSHWNINNIRAHYYNEQGGNNGWPGDLMTKTIYENIYSIKIKKELNMTNIIFNDGSNQIPEVCKPGFSITDSCLYNSMDFEKKNIEKDSNLEDTIFFKVPNHWNKNNVRAHYYNEQGGNNGWPGNLMTKTIYENIYCLKIKKELNMTNIIFNDGSNQIPEVYKPGFSITDNCLYNWKKKL